MGEIMNDTLPVPHPMSATFMSDLIPNFTKDYTVDEENSSAWI